MEPKEYIVLGLKAETLFIAMAVTLLACLLKNQGILIAAFMLAGFFRDAIVFDRRPTMRTVGQCILFLIVVVAASVPLFAVSWQMGVAAFLLVCIWTVLAKATYEFNIVGQFRERIHPAEIHEIRMMDAILFMILRHSVICFLFAVLNIYIEGNWLPTIACLAFGAVLLGIFLYNWFRGAVLDGLSLKVTGLNRGKYLLEDLTITMTSNGIRHIVFRDNHGKTILKTSMFDQNVAYAEHNLRKARMIKYQ